ncbi:amidohydrolase [Oceanobacillus sp. J11TS1]|uniref:amidohydrolase n=1 Tax=Oceanobacillus sp. J11TS1 TaxID=2807191 RepID=UPI001B0DAED5|nr:amidohydrolase [Oceanobacillus sp. J11TS1]GIO21676.1 putative amidohydrolase YtcJ [Oceanobacillus sp. J11TS1]
MIKIYTNGVIHTFQSFQPVVEAVVVKDGRFIDIGSSSQILAFWGAKSDAIIDLEGKTVTPGLTDTHLHLSLQAMKFIDLDITGVTKKEVFLNKVRQHATTLDKGEWLIGAGWDENLFTDGGLPTKDELDAAVPNHPLYLTRICEHAAVVNSKALERINYSSTTPIPEGGEIVTDRNGEPTGLILESASALFKAKIPDKSFQTWKKALRKTMNRVMQYGITSVHSNDPAYLGGLQQTYQLYEELLNQEKLGLRTNLLIDYDFLEDLHQKGMYTGYGNSNLQIGAVKIFADGALGRRTALLKEEYTDQPGQIGEAMLTQDNLYNIVKRARQLAMPVAVHTIGDQALENVLDILDQFPAAAYRDRLIHAQVINPNLVKRLANPNRIVDIQPRFLASDYPWVKDRLGEARMPYAYAWKTLLDNGVICGGGSDAPVEPINPLLGIHAAVTRKAPGETHHGWYPEQKLTIQQAFYLFTKYAAFTTNEENLKGTISRGKLADMTVYSADPFKIRDADELLDISIEMTIIGGDKKYIKR